MGKVKISKLVKMVMFAMVTMAFQEVVRENYGEQVKLEAAGEYFEGRLIKVKHNVKTKYGTTTVLVFRENAETIKSIFVSAALALYEWDDMIGQLVRIEYLGETYNEKTGQDYKAFKVLIDKG